MTQADLLKELTQMSAAERILLAQDLWDSVSDDPGAWKLTPAQARELDARLKAFQARRARGEEAGSSWQEARRRIRREARHGGL